MKFNWKLFNWSAWITLALTYVLPCQSTDGFAASYGYPFPFLTSYNNGTLKASLFISNNINLILLVQNILIIYLILFFVNKLLIRQKNAEV
jgi:hypothetical protein